MSTDNTSAENIQPSPAGEGFVPRLGADPSAARYELLTAPQAVDRVVAVGFDRNDAELMVDQYLAANTAAFGTPSGDGWRVDPYDLAEIARGYEWVDHYRGETIADARARAAEYAADYERAAATVDREQDPGYAARIDREAVEWADRAREGDNPWPVPDPRIATGQGALSELTDEQERAEVEAVSKALLENHDTDGDTEGDDGPGGGLSAPDPTGPVGPVDTAGGAGGDEGEPSWEAEGYLRELETAQDDLDEVEDALRAARAGDWGTAYEFRGVRRDMNHEEVLRELEEEAQFCQDRFDDASDTYGEADHHARTSIQPEVDRIQDGRARPSSVLDVAEDELPTAEQAARSELVTAASWAVAARDAAIERGDTEYAARFARDAREAMDAAEGAGITREQLADELDYPGGAAELDGEHIGVGIDTGAPVTAAELAGRAAAFDALTERYPLPGDPGGDTIERGPRGEPQIVEAGPVDDTWWTGHAERGFTFTDAAPTDTAPTDGEVWGRDGWGRGDAEEDRRQQLNQWHHEQVDEPGPADDIDHTYDIDTDSIDTDSVGGDR